MPKTQDCVYHGMKIKSMSEVGRDYSRMLRQSRVEQYPIGPPSQIYMLYEDYKKKNILLHLITW